MKTLLLGLLIVGVFAVWKFVIQPRMNEDKPIEPNKNHKTIGEQLEDQMKESFNPNIDF